MMLNAALAFLDSLDARRRAHVQLPFDGEERFFWSYIPQDRRGLPLGEMNLEQRRALHALLRATLSSAGYLKATTIMQLEEVLQLLEPNNPERHPERYYITIFGVPAARAPWSWRIEGHHLSLHFTAVTAQLVTVTPAFWGANPAEVPVGPRAGLRALGAEEDLGRQLLTMLDDGQRAHATLSTTAPDDIITATDRAVRLAHYEGIVSAGMTRPQHEALMRIVTEYTNNLEPVAARAQLARIETAGLEHLYFAWAGSPVPGAPHYYRIHGPTLLIEYDNTQGHANHAHSVFRDLQHDFGGDALARHYAESDHHTGRAGT